MQNSTHKKVVTKITIAQFSDLTNTLAIHMTMKVIKNTLAIHNYEGN